MKKDLELLLPLNLQFFAEGEGEGGQGEGGEQGETNTEKETGKEKELSIPKTRFDEVNEAKKALEKQIADFEAKAKEQEEAAKAKAEEDAAKKGEYESLYNSTKQEVATHKAEVKAAKSRIEELEGVVNGLLESKLATIDKDFHDLIPQGMTPEQKLAWVNTAESKGLFGNSTAKTPLGSSNTNPNGTQTKETDEMSPLEKMMAGYNK